LYNKNKKEHYTQNIKNVVLHNKGKPMAKC